MNRHCRFWKTSSKMNNSNSKYVISIMLETNQERKGWTGFSQQKRTQPSDQSEPQIVYLTKPGKNAAVEKRQQRLFVLGKQKH